MKHIHFTSLTKGCYEFVSLVVLPILLMGCSELELKRQTLIHSETVSEVTATSAKIQAAVTSISDQAQTMGLCYSTTSSPTVNNAIADLGKAQKGPISATLQSLHFNQTYFVRIFVKENNQIDYGKTLSFTTINIALPRVSITENTNITAQSAAFTCKVTPANDGILGTVSQVGICWNTLENPTLNDNSSTKSFQSATFASQVTDLQVNTTYYFRAYAINEAGIGYSATQQLTTLDGLPEITTTTIGSITGNSAVSGGTITDNGGFYISSRGICWHTHSSPTIQHSLTKDGTGTGSYSSYLHNLAPNTTYYLRAYATNEAGTAYGQEKSFTTLDILPSVTTATISAITDTSAVSGGSITDNGGYEITQRGICWSASKSPTLNDYYSDNGRGMGTFTSQLIHLTPQTTFYVRAYAKNQAGTAYGEEKSFTTTASQRVP